MICRTMVMLSAVALTWGGAGALPAQQINPQTLTEQKKAFRELWNAELETRFDKLPIRGRVPRERHPYAGHIYPDSTGGTLGPLRKYDAAFHGGDGRATAFEQRDISNQSTSQVRRGLFGLPVYSHGMPHWVGHCNGWTAAAIRHTEPKKSVSRGGVTFTPADIKGLLAELYVYSKIRSLGGERSDAVNPGILHINLANWIGRGQHPIGMDSTMGNEVWNYPIYNYTGRITQRGERYVDVRTTIGYVYLTEQEHQRAPKRYRKKELHYRLHLNDRGEIVGGYYFGDSAQLDLIWVPLLPTKGGTAGNELGNPHLDVDTVLSIWRESAPLEERMMWWVVDPAEADKVHLK